MRCVTSFGPDGYKLYGKRFLETYVKHVGLPIDVYIEGDEPDFKHKAVTYRDLRKVVGLREYLAMVDFPMAHGHPWGEEKYNYNFDTFKFCRKSFAQIDAASRNGDYLFWIDADVEFNAPFEFPSDFDFMVYLGRPEWHSCTSFVGWNLKHPGAGEWFRRYWMIHVTGTIFGLPGLTDCHVVDFLREQSGLPAINLAEGIEGLNGPANVFDSVFTCAKHAKGNIKHRNRYSELMAEIEKRKPQRILEIGVWNGNRAIEMCRHGAEYIGFDLFEDANAETDYVEKNVKAHNSIEAVAERLKQAGVKATLIKGNTRETLPAYHGEVDFAFIDGGHSVETIRSDWESVQKLVRPGGLVIFDDYYEDMPDHYLELWGANKILEGMNYRLSESRDPVAGGGVTRLAFVNV